MWVRIKKCCEEVLASYPTTREQDEEILKDTSKLSFVESNCINLRLNEKKIFIYMLEQSEYFIKLLAMTRKEADLMVIGKDSSNHIIQYYRNINKWIKN